jgi:hypothetical protein
MLIIDHFCFDVLQPARSHGDQNSSVRATGLRTFFKSFHNLQWVIQVIYNLIGL